jgi:MoxR-like ATPase
MLKLKIPYPKKTEEREIIRRYAKETSVLSDLGRIVSKEDIFAMRRCAEGTYLDEKIESYVIDIVFKTREPSPYIACGASPRASICLVKAAKCRAFIAGRDYVTPDDIKDLAYDVLRHRVLLSYEAEAENISAEKLIENILEEVNIP